ncbi:MAG: hypothetical protein OXC15_02505 [Rhodospirillaceae bacterium]|nr:hypothetical protein [Rhodospirillaceae bacterium]
MSGTPAASAAAPAEDGDTQARLIVDEAAARYCAARRAKIDDFVDRNFSLSGTLRLHRRALGWDLIRSPANLALSAPHLAARVSAGLARHAGLTPAADWLDSRRYFLQTDVARELEWRLFTEFLELPIQQGERVSDRDALAAEILRDSRIAAGCEGAPQSPADREAFRAWLAGAASTYEGTRVSAADLATAAVSAGVGALAFKKLTPGMLSLGPATAQVLVQHAAIAGFPLGSGAGALWYGAFPAAAPAALSIGLTGGLLAAGAVIGAFSGVVTDPIQRGLGLHQRRLRRLIDCLERELTGQGDSRFTVRDHYVARTLDVIEALGLVWRAAR